MSTDVEAPEAVESVVSVPKSVRSIVEDLRESATVRSVYGEPIAAQNKTIIPVARIAYGFGGGSGAGGEDDGQGAGVGGGVAATPVGVVEVTDAETRFVRRGQRSRLGIALVFGLVLGLLLGRRGSSE